MAPKPSNPVNGIRSAPPRKSVLRAWSQLGPNSDWPTAYLGSTVPARRCRRFEMDNKRKCDAFSALFMRRWVAR